MEGRSARRNKLPKAGGKSQPGAEPLARAFLIQAGHALQRQHLPRITECVDRLSEEDVWWRPNSASNSVGNLVLHLAGNVHQWIVAGLGGEPDIRNRDLEFREQGPVPRRALRALLEKEVRAAGRVILRLGPEELLQIYSIQNFHVTALQAVAHVVEHFAHHSGQIIYVTKLRLGEDLKFTRLPGGKTRRPRSRRLPAV
ncbi:MAG: DinB family protein [Terriglobia bacterium]